MTHPTGNSHEKILKNYSLISEDKVLHLRENCPVKGAYCDLFNFKVKMVIQTSDQGLEGITSFTDFIANNPDGRDRLKMARAFL